MSNVIQIKHGNTVPTVNNLQPYELGYVSGGALYINNNGVIAQLTNPKTISLVDANNRLKLPSVANTTSDYGRFLVSDSQGVVYYKTAANVLSELKALPLAGGVVTGATTFNGALIVGPNNWGTVDPNTANIPGVAGQMYFVIPE